MDQQVTPTRERRMSVPLTHGRTDFLHSIRDVTAARITAFFWPAAVTAPYLGVRLPELSQSLVAPEIPSIPRHLLVLPATEPAVPPGSADLVLRHPVAAIRSMTLEIFQPTPDGWEQLDPGDGVKALAVVELTFLEQAEEPGVWAPQDETPPL